MSIIDTLNVVTLICQSSIVGNCPSTGIWYTNESVAHGPC